MSTFGVADWAVVLGVLVGTTVLGERLAGRQKSARDFFLGGRRLPWYAVAASIVATEISAVTYVSFPSGVAREGGNMTYLQIVLFGSLLARAFVGYVLVPAYYKHEIYSPYDYVGRRLGARGKTVTSALFALGGVLGQSARVYMTALVLGVLLQSELAQLQEWTGLPPLVSSVLVITAVAVAWTWMGGIATVVWTDAVLFVLFLVGIGAALATVAGNLEGGLSEAMSTGWEAGKFQVVDLSMDPRLAYTLMMALVFSSWGQIGPYGCDQLMVQRLFCCRDAREARKAILASTAAAGVVFMMGVVGVALFSYYRANPMGAEEASLVAEAPDRLFPLFVKQVMSSPWKGLVVAGVFAAAISSLDSILAALSQTTLSAIVIPRRRRRLEAAGLGAGGEEQEARWMVRASRWLVLGWGVVLAAAAVGASEVAKRYESVLDLALAMAGYTGGALLAAFFLAFLPLRPRSKGFAWSASLSVMTVFAIVWHGAYAERACMAFALLLVLAWFLRGAHREAADGVARVAPSVFLVLGALLPWVLCRYAVWPDGTVLPWPTYIPIGSLTAFLFALALDPVGSEPTDPVEPELA